jgi:hypothetical protein
VSDAWDSLILRHQLTFAEATRIRDEVGTGRAFAEPHMRAAAAEWAQHRLDTEGIAHIWASRRGRILLVVWVIFVAGGFVWRLGTHLASRSPAGLGLALGSLALNLCVWWIGRRRLRATITRNQGPLDGGDDARPDDTRR